MKQIAKTLTSLAAATLIACMFSTPSLRAADEKEAKDKKSKEPVVTDAVLKKYDANKNGKLDPAEEAAWKADLAKEKAEKKEKKSEKKEEKNN
jgi:hypothetical protein